MSLNLSPYFGSRVATCAVTAIALLAPVAVQGQCRPLADSATLQVPASQSSSTRTPEFYDEPSFTVAGVTDTTNLGGHASGTSVRAETISKEVVSLSKQPGNGLQPALNAPAVDKFREAVEREPGSFEANHRLGKALVESGKAGEAIPYLERASQLNPGDYENGFELALAYVDAGNYERARSSIRSLLTARDRAELHQFLGDVEEKAGNSLDAVREYQRAAEMDPSESNLFGWGAELLAHRAIDPAIQVFSKGNRLFPRSGRMLIGLGVAWYARGSYDYAADCLCEAADLNPNDPTAYLFLGKVQDMDAAGSQAIAEKLERFVKLQPENAMANYYYALSVWKRRKGPDDAGTSEQAKVWLEKAVRLDPKLGAGYLQLGILYSERSDLPRAISAFEKATEASPQLEEAHYRLAQAYRRGGEESKAEKELQLYKQLSKEAAEHAQRERHEMQQFVYTLRDRGSGTQPR